MTQNQVFQKTKVKGGNVMLRGKTINLVMLFLFLGLVPCVTLAATTQGVTEKEIVIGLFAPYTGPAQLFGYPMAAGVTMIYKDVNEKGGIHGRTIKYIEEDDGCGNEKALAAAKKLIYDHKVFILHGGNCSGPTYAAKDTIVEAGIPFMFMGGGMDAVSYPTVKNIFTAQLPGTGEGKAIATFILSNPKFKRIAILSHPDEWGMTKYKPAVEMLNASGRVEIVADERIDRRVNDATVQIMRIKQANPDVCFFNTYPVEGIIVMRDAQKYGLSVPVISGMSWDLEDIVTKLPYDAIKNVYNLSIIKAALNSKEMEPWVKLCKKYHPDVKITSLTFTTTPGALLIVEALKRCGRDLTWQNFLGAIESIQNFDVGVLPYPVGFTKTDHQANKRGTFFRILPNKAIEAIGDTWPAR